MKSKKNLRLIFPVVLIALVSWLATSCSRPEQKMPDNVAYYTCPMHPSVRSQDSKARCPICGMALVPVKKNSAPADQSAQTNSPAEESPGEFKVAIERQQQIGVTYTKVETRPLELTIRTVGVVTYDKQRHWDYVSRFEGYVQKLEVSSRGDLVEKGQALMSIYSAELSLAQREFVNLLRSRDEAKKSGSQPALASIERMLEAARHRFNVWNISEKQVSDLEQTRESQSTLMFYSPFKGVVQDLLVDQGRRVNVGDHLVDIADLSVVWVWADFYQDELPLLKKDQPITITSQSYPDQKFPGKIQVIDPFLNDAKRTGRVRLEILNPDLKLRPDMYVDVELKLDLGKGLAVPVSAVLPTGAHNIVFVDKDAGKLEPRFIELGRKFGDFYAVKLGLSEGERVVSSANFLIDAEAKIQGALKSW